MKVLLAIPSYNRPYEIEKKCLFWLKELKDIDWKIFIRSEQYVYYSQLIPKNNLVCINVNSFRETINAIGEYAKSNSYDLVHKIDDDMSFKKLGMSKRKDCSAVYTESYNTILNKFKSDEDVYGITISKPMFHMRAKNLMFARENKAMYGNQFIKTELLYMPEGIELYDDIFISLQILKLGKKILTYTGAYEDAVCYTNAGGLQSYDRNQLGIETIKVMQKHFPLVQQGFYKGNENMIDIDLKNLNIR